MSLKMFALAGLAIPAVLAAGPSAQAEEVDLSGFYVTTEANSDWTGDDYDGTTIDVRVGYETELSETVTGYVEVGPAFSLPDGGDQDTEMGAEAGLSVAASQNLELFAEIEVITGEDYDYGTKIGATYRF